MFEPQSEGTPICVLSSGLIKLYYLVADGDEWTKSLVLDRGVFGPSSPEDSVTQFGARALENAIVGKLRPEWLGTQLSGDPQLAETASAFQAWLFERKRQREEDMLCLPADERYLRFLAREPDLAQRLEQQEIAGFLRVTPVALSRIRRRLKADGRLPEAA